MPQTNARERQPDGVMQVGGTRIRIVAPLSVTSSEQRVRHDNIVRAVASCLDDRDKSAGSGEPERPHTDLE